MLAQSGFPSSSEGERQIRRGTRIPCEISAVLQIPNCEPSAAERCDIILVNPHGCAIRFYRPLQVGAEVKLQGLPAPGDVNARVVNCISMGKHENFWLLGLSLAQPGNVWGIQDPPKDWD